MSSFGVEGDLGTAYARRELATLQLGRAAVFSADDHEQWHIEFAEYVLVVDGSIEHVATSLSSRQHSHRDRLSEPGFRHRLGGEPQHSAPHGGRTQLRIAGHLLIAHPIHFGDHRGRWWRAAGGWVGETAISAGQHDSAQPLAAVLAKVVTDDQRAVRPADQDDFACAGGVDDTRQIVSPVCTGGIGFTRPGLARKPVAAKVVAHQTKVAVQLRCCELRFEACMALSEAMHQNDDGLLCGSLFDDIERHSFGTLYGAVASMLGRRGVCAV